MKDSAFSISGEAAVVTEVLAPDVVDPELSPIIDDRNSFGDVDWFVKLVPQDFGIWCSFSLE